MRFTSDYERVVAGRVWQGFDWIPARAMPALILIRQTYSRKLISISKKVA